MIVEPYFRAGSRLKPRVYRAGDLEVLDTVTEGSWYDVETGEWCDFRVGANGIERCFPNNTVIETEPNQQTYSDAGCTRPALRGSNQLCGRTTSYLTAEPASGCSYRTYRLGTPLPYNTPIYEKREGSCRRLPAPVDTSLSVLPLEEVPPETFVAVKRVSRPHHPGMNALVREGEDGSSEIVGFSEPGSDVPCFGLGRDVTPQACVPGWLRVWDHFSDAACMQRVGFDLGPRCTGRTTSVLLEMTPNAESCEPSQSITALWQSAEVRSTPVFERSNGLCEMNSTELVEAHVQGAPISLASLPQLEVIEVGGGPLRVPFYGFGGVPFLPAPHGEGRVSPGPFIEAASGEPCEPQLLPDGTWRCVTTSFRTTTEWDLYYESADCTGQPTFPASELRYCEGEQPAPRGVVVQALGSINCLAFPVIDIFEFGEKADPPRSLSRPTGSSTCRPVSLGNGPSTLRLNKVNPAELFIPIERTLKD